MGTRARINIIHHDQRLVSIYRQFDGNPAGLGQEIADFSGKLEIVNGYSTKEPGVQANGMGCFAAMLIKHLKVKIGNVYIRNTSDKSHGEEFIYDLSERNGRVWMSVYSGHGTMFGNPGNEQSNMKCVWNGFTSNFDHESHVFDC